MANMLSLTEAIDALVFTCLFMILLCYVTTKYRQYKSIRKQLVLPPGPTPWPMVGCIPQMLWKKPVFRWIHLFMEEKGIEIACFRFGKVHVFPVTCPNIAKQFLKKQDAAFASRPLTMATDILSDGYKTTALSPYGGTWKKMRKLLTSEILSPAKLRSLQHKRDDEADNLLKYLYCQSSKKGDGVVDIRVACQAYAGNIARRMMFNKRYFGLEREDGGPTFREQEYVVAALVALKYIYAFCVSDYLPSLLGLDLDGHEKIIKDAYMTILKYHEPIIDERIDKWRNASANDPTTMKVEDFLDVWVSLKSSDGSPLLTREEIIAQATERAIAAIDNTSNTAEWAIAEMINKPHLMDRALDELDKVVGKGRLVQEQDLHNLKYIRACTRESLRLHPVTPFNLPHVSMCDTVVAGYHIPKGSHVLLSRMGLGRNPRVWDDPLEYKPERHLPDDYDALKNNCGNISLGESDLRFISFSAGRRSCAGMELGTTTTVMLLARVLQGFLCKAPPNVSKISLEEGENGLYLRHPLLAALEPRLPLHLYPYN